MPYSFGLFSLDENSRTLSFGGRNEDVQPLVFDLIHYLVRNAGRVVPKDELMDRLWPNVTVTEASLQRAVSMARRALSIGGMSTSIRSYVRHGYRFAIDDASLGQVEPPSPSASRGVEQARDLARRREWERAAKAFADIDKTAGLTPVDIDVWAMAVECGGRPVNAIPVLTQAVTAHIDAGDNKRAARAAITLSKINLERGAPAVAAGWLDRASALLEGSEAPEVMSYLLWMRSRLATMGGQPETALDLASAAHSIAEGSGDAGMTALTLAYKGFYNLSLGRTGEGTDQQNHAAAIALSSQVDPVTGSLVYCNILWSCRTFADWSRARQWSQGFETWCKASFAETPGACDLHRAEVVGAQRELPAALEAINEALPKLRDEESWSLGDGYRVRGDIHAMIGNLDAARQDYDMAYALNWDAEPGNALLLAELGDAPAALTALKRALRGTTWFDLQRRGILLGHAARIAALAGQADTAAAHLAEIESQPERWPQPSIRAAAAEARAALCRPGDPEAFRLLSLARQLWTSAQSEYHSARVRLLLAELLARNGDASSVRAELVAARLSADRIGARALSDRISALQAALEAQRSANDLMAIRTVSAG